jgi:hypothetical protein
MMDPTEVHIARRLNRLERLMNGEAIRHRLMARRAEEIRQELQRTPADGASLARWSVRDALIPLAAWVLDFVLFSPGVEFILGFLFPTGAPAWLVVAARALFPLLMVVVELELSEAAERARRAVLPPANPTAAALPWLGLGLLVGVIPPLGTAYAMYRAALAVDPHSAGTVFLQSGVFGAVSATGHLLVLLRGHLALEAYEAMWQRIRTGLTASRLRRAETKLTACERRIVQHFGDYSILTQSYHQLSGRNWQHSLIDDVVRILNREYRREVIPRQPHGAPPVEIPQVTDPAEEEVIE